MRRSEQRQPAQRAGEHQVGESEGHSERSCCAGDGRRLRGRSAGGERADERPCHGSRHLQVVVAGVVLKHDGGEALVDDQEAVEEFAAEGVDEAFGDRVRPRCPALAF